MNRQEEKHLIALIKAGDKNARRKMIEALYPKLKFIAKDYANNNVPFDDLVQEGAEVVVKVINNIENYDLSKNRIITIANRAVRNKIKTFITNNGNNISHSKYNVLRKNVNKIVKAITHSYNEPIGDYGLGEDFLGEWDIPDRLSLHTTLLNVLNEYLTLEQEDYIKLHYGFGMVSIDDWQKEKKAMSLRKIADMAGIGVKRVRDQIDNAMLILKTDEIKHKLDEFN